MWKYKLAAAATIVYGTYKLGQTVEENLKAKKIVLPSEEERMKTFDKLAPLYDQKVERDEITIGVKNLREELLKYATGNVLETAAGTGRNSSYYPSTITSLTLTDASEEMLHIARFKEFGHPPKEKIHFQTEDATKLSFDNEKFDTIVDTFGLCSYSDPTVALKEMERVLKKGGKLLLLEHGISTWKVVALYQQWKLQQHVLQWGCIWNRDLEQIIRKACGDEIEIETVKKSHFGTTVMIIAHKK